MTGDLIAIHLSDTALLDALAPPAAGEAVTVACCRRADVIEAIAGRFQIPREKADAALDALLGRAMDRPARVRS